MRNYSMHGSNVSYFLMYQNSCITASGSKLIETLKSESFLKHKNQLSSTYQYGMISDLSRSSDDKIHKSIVRYRNSAEAADRLTNCAVR